jgi:hypothetical protein
MSEDPSAEEEEDWEASFFELDNGGSRTALFDYLKVI